MTHLNCLDDNNVTALVVTIHQFFCSNFNQLVRFFFGAAELSGPDDVIVRMDCDDTHEPAFIPQMLAKLEDGYDVVYWNDVFEHVPCDEIQPLLAKIYSLVRPGGCLVTITPNWHERPSDVTGASVNDPVTSLPQVVGASWTCVAAGSASCTAGPVAGDIGDTVNLPVGGTVTYTLDITTLPGAVCGALPPGLRARCRVSVGRWPRTKQFVRRCS